MVIRPLGGRTVPYWFSMTSLLQSVAINVKTWRMRRGMSLSTLARLADVSKSTVSQIERHNGNPSLETLWALARALEVPLGFLLNQPAESNGVHIVRHADVTATFQETGYISQLLTGWEMDGEVEVYSTTMEEGAIRESASHGAGVAECVIVIEGRASVQVGSEAHEISVGDLMWFPADRPHTYRAIDGPARMIGIHSYPRPRVGDRRVKV